MTQRELFLKHIAQTSPTPIGLEIDRAKGCKLWDKDGKEYFDLIAGISVCNIGHRNPKVLKAIKEQLNHYLHLLVYGEMIETPQVQYARFLVEHLPLSLNSVYFTNSGAEATEGALKLAKRVTGRTQLIAFKKSYHGSTHGALSVMGDEYWRNAFRPLLPDVHHLEYNSFEALQSITSNTACVIAETIQAEAAVIAPFNAWLNELRNRCTETGALLILDEIQTGFGRTGKLWAFEQYGIVPDIVLLGKALGGGMPLGAFIADRTMMQTLTNDPVLGHITTFGGHPVSCAAGMAAMKVLLKGSLIDKVHNKGQLFRQVLSHKNIKEVRTAGLLIAVEFENKEMVTKLTERLVQEGILTDWFLFAPHCLRIAPPLTIRPKEIKMVCDTIMKCVEEL